MVALGRIAWMSVWLAAFPVWSAGDAGLSDSVDAGVLDASTEGDETEGLESQRAAIETLIGGAIPERWTTAQLFPVDVRDEAAVARRRTELEQQLAGDDAGMMPVARRAVLEARLRFLLLPQAARVGVLELEAQALAQAMARETAAQGQAEALEQRQAAEAAQQRALEAAARAEEAERRALATERARLESVRVELAAAKERLAARRTEWVTASQRRTAAAQALRTRATETAAGTAQADQLYDEVVQQVVAARKMLREGLEAMADVPQQPRAEVSRGALGTDPDLEADRRALAQLVSELNQQASTLEVEARQAAFDDAESAADHAKALNAIRLSLLPRLSADKRARTLGLGLEGREQLVRELEHVRLSAAWLRRAEGPTVIRWVRQLADPFVLAEFIFRVLGLAGLLALARFLSGRLPAWLRLSRSFIVRVVRRAVWARRLVNAVDAVAAISPELVLLGVVLLVGIVAAPLLERPLLVVPYAIVVDYAIYRLAIRVSHRLIGYLAWTPLGALSEERSERVLRSVRLVGRYAFGLHVFFVLSETMLGRGYLYSVASRFGWLGALPIVWALMTWWREDIADAYLVMRPDGALANLVKRSRDRSYAFLVGVAAFLMIFLAWVGRAARRFVMRFDQTRKALAYVFRKRLERRAGERGEDAEEVAPPAIPPEVLAQFAPKPVDHEPFVVDRFPELDAFEEAFLEWKARDDEIGAWLVVGRTGFGKTSWLNAATAKTAGVPAARISLDHRLDDPAALVALLATTLGLTAQSPSELAEALRTGPRRVLVIDDLQNLMLRGGSRTTCWDALQALIRDSGPTVFWLGAIAYQPFQYLAWARRGHGTFRRVVALKRWSESEIRQLLEARTASSGWTVSYQDLLVAHLDDRSAGAQIVQTAQEFTRLIWDYAEGSPRVALDCWARSLVPDGPRRLRVKLFTRPRDSVLESIDEVGRFVLSAVVWHENIDVDETATVLAMPPGSCRDALRRLTEEGVLVEDSHRRFRVTVAWWPGVNRFLIRRHLIMS